MNISEGILHHLILFNELQNNYIDLSVADLRVQGDLTYKITKDLRYEFVGALRYVESTREHQITENANMAEAYRAAGTTVIKQNNRFLYRDPDDPNAEPIVVLPYGGFYNRAEDKLVSYDVRNNINYSRIFDNHSINLLGGMQVKSADRQAFSNTGYGYQYGTGGVPFIDYRILKQTVENNFPYYQMSKFYDRFVAFYGTGNYSYDSKYNLTATVRYDGSNRLGKSKQARWLPTWSVAGSWNIDRESFMENENWLDYLTLRGSYGLTASMGPATNSSIVLQNVISNRPYLTEKESVIQLLNLENSGITWEKLYTANLGLDAGFFNRRMNVSIDVYTRKSFDLISRIKTSGIGGELYKAANYADMDSYGAELLIGGNIVQTKDWGWRSNLTFGYNETRITNAKNEPRIFDLVAAEGGNKVGYPTSGLFSLNFQGLNDQNGVPLFINEKGQTTSDIFLQDLNTDYLVFEGPVDPIWTSPRRRSRRRSSAARASPTRPRPSPTRSRPRRRRRRSVRRPPRCRWARRRLRARFSLDTARGRRRKRMPVSKKRKKDGKPVHRAQPAEELASQPEEHESHPAAAPPARVGKPSNPFVAQQTKRASQRGR